jgi:predicted nucleic acid-binding protein
MTFLDTSTLVGAVLEQHPEHAACLSAFELAKPFSNSHALAETFATLTGFYKVPTDAAIELTLGLQEAISIEPLRMEDYENAISQARKRGVMGGGIYDSLHATFARRKGARRVVTRNPSHFAHVAPELEILSPSNASWFSPERFPMAYVSPTRNGRSQLYAPSGIPSTAATARKASPA